MASLFEAIVMQNLSVLTRGNTLRPTCCCSAARTATSGACASAGSTTSRRSGKSATTQLPEGVRPEDLIKRPGQRAVLRGLGAVEFGKSEEDDGVGSLPGTREAGMVHQRRPLRRRRPSGRQRGLAKDDGRAGGLQGEVPSQEVRPGDVPAGRGGRRLRRPRRRLDFHQGRAHGQGPQRPRARPTSSPRATRSRTRWRFFGSCEQQVADQGATLKILGVGTTGYAKDILKDVLGADVALVETVAHTEVGAALLRRRRRDLRRRRPGHQAHHPEERPRQGLQAQHAVLGGQRLLPAVHGRGLRLPGRGVRRPRLRRRGDARSSATAARCSCSPTSSTSSARAGSRKRSWPGWRRAAEEHLAVRLADPEPVGARHAASCCRAARSTTWRR